jgi:hypothetical protein
MHNKFTNCQYKRKSETSSDGRKPYSRERTRQNTTPHAVKLKADHIDQRSNAIIQARLRKATLLRRLKVTRLLNSQQMNGFKEMLSTAIVKLKANTAYVLAEASNDPDYFEAVAKEVLYGAA